MTETETIADPAEAAEHSGIAVSAEAAESTPPQQEEMPFAIVQGAPLTELPRDLYIPPDALEVFLEAFEGPLDLLLYLIRRQNLDILDIPIAEITKQYIEYVDMMSDMHLELAAEYLVMAAMLAEIKSRMLLPRQVEEADEEVDPRADLVRRLQEYEQYKQAAGMLDNCPVVGRDVFNTRIDVPEIEREKIEPEVTLQDLLSAFNDVMKRASLYSHHHIESEPLSVRERMSEVLSSIKSAQFTDFFALFDVKEGRAGVVVTLLAILELMKETLIEMVQNEPYGPIHVKAHTA